MSVQQKHGGELSDEGAVHVAWPLAASREHRVIACCIKEGSDLAEVRRVVAHVLQA